MLVNKAFPFRALSFIFIHFNFHILLTIRPVFVHIILFNYDFIEQYLFCKFMIIHNDYSALLMFNMSWGQKNTTMFDVYEQIWTIKHETQFLLILNI